jgi:hypothetical protein
MTIKFQKGGQHEFTQREATLPSVSNQDGAGHSSLMSPGQRPSYGDGAVSVVDISMQPADLSLGLGIQKD